MTDDARKWLNAYQELDRRCRRLEASLERLVAVLTTTGDEHEMDAATTQAIEAMKPEAINPRKDR